MKNLKKIVAVLLAVMLLGALAACGGDTKTDQPTSGGDIQQGGNQILETGLKQVAELEIVAGAEEPATLEISQLTEAADNAVLADFNTDIQAKLTEWQQSLMEGETLSVRACVLDTENYLSVLLTKEVTPNYGSDAEVYYYVYDRIVDNKMDVEYAKAWMSLIWRRARNGLASMQTLFTLTLTKRLCSWFPARYARRALTTGLTFTC